MNLYPLLMSPSFLSGSDTPWGGDMLRDAFLKDAPAATGVSLEVSALSGHESIIANGEFAGMSLARAAEELGEALTGLPAGSEFPLRLRLLDAAEAMPPAAGNSEAWIILNAEPGAEIICGDSLILPRPGDVYYIPAGMSRSLGAGIQAYSLQGTAAADQSGCALHPQGTTALCRGGSRTYYVCDAAMELSRLNVSGCMPLPSGRMLALTPIAPCTLAWEDGELELSPFSTALIPAALDGACVRGTLKVFAAALPDRDALRREMDYRAELIAGLG